MIFIKYSFWDLRLKIILTHNILISKRKILLLQEDLPPNNRRPRRNSFFTREDFFRRNFILGPKDRFSECIIMYAAIDYIIKLLFERLRNCIFFVRYLIFLILLISTFISISSVFYLNYCNF